MNAAFRIKRSSIGNYWQVRVRDLNTGNEDTVDRLYTEEEVIRKRTALIAAGMKDLS